MPVTHHPPLSLPAPEAADPGARGRLLEAATSLFARKGYAATAVREIVEAAGVTKPTLYYHFTSKEGLYLALMHQAMDELEAHLAGLGASSGAPWDRIRGLCLGVLRLAEERLALVRLLYALYYGPPQGAPAFDLESFPRRLEEAIRSLLAEAVAAGALPRDRLDDVAVAIVGLTSYAIDLALSQPERAPGLAGLERLLDLVGAGYRRGRRRQPTRMEP